MDAALPPAQAAQTRQSEFFCPRPKSPSPLSCRAAQTTARWKSRARLESEPYATFPIVSPQPWEIEGEQETSRGRGERSDHKGDFTSPPLYANPGKMRLHRPFWPRFLSPLTRLGWWEPTLPRLASGLTVFPQLRGLVAGMTSEIGTLSLRVMPHLAPRNVEILRNVRIF
jgi:hypothetical protein